MTSAGAPQDVVGVRVTPDWFRAVGVEEREPNGWFAALEPDRPVAVVREDLWPTPPSAGARPRVVTLDGVPHTVVGVLPAGFTYPDSDTKVWIPLRLDALSPRVGERTVALVGRLRPGVAPEAAETELRRLSLEMQAAHPEGYLAAYGVPWSIEIAANSAVPREQLPLVILLFAAAATLVVGAGIGVGLLSRASGPGLERTLGGAVLMGGAAALGGCVLALGQQWMVETLGVGVAHESGRAALMAVGFLGAGTVAAAALTVVAPRAGLSLGAVALSVTGAVLVVTLAAVLGRAYGFRLQPALVAEGLVAFPGRGRALDEHIVGRVSQVPGVRTAALTSSIPGVGKPRSVTLEVESSVRTAKPAPGTEIITVTAGYIHVAGLTLLDGRDLLPRGDSSEQPRHEAVVNRELAARFWPSGSAVGRRLVVQLTGSPTPWLTIVGVVDDGRRLQRNARPVAAIYLPPGLGAEPLSALLVRGDLPPADLVASLHRSGATPVGTFGHPMAVDSVIRDATAPYRAGRGLLGLVAVAAVLFATMALVAANGRAAWRGLALGLAGGIGALWCGSGLLTAVPGLAVSPLALGLGLVAGLVGVIDLVALRRTLWRRSV